MYGRRNSLESSSSTNRSGYDRLSSNPTLAPVYESQAHPPTDLRNSSPDNSSGSDRGNSHYSGNSGSDRGNSHYSGNSSGESEQFISGTRGIYPRSGGFHTNDNNRDRRSDSSLSSVGNSHNSSGNEGYYVNLSHQNSFSRYDASSEGALSSRSGSSRSSSDGSFSPEQPIDPHQYGVPRNMFEQRAYQARAAGSITGAEVETGLGLVRLGRGRGAPRQPFVTSRQENYGNVSMRGRYQEDLSPALDNPGGRIRDNSSSDPHTSSDSVRGAMSEETRYEHDRMQAVERVAGHLLSIIDAHSGPDRARRIENATNNLRNSLDYRTQRAGAMLIGITQWAEEYRNTGTGAEARGALRAIADGAGSFDDFFSNYGRYMPSHQGGALERRQATTIDAGLGSYVRDQIVVHRTYSHRNTTPSASSSSGSSRSLQNRFRTRPAPGPSNQM